MADDGGLVAEPLFESPDYDVLADWGDRVERVQVKTSTCWRNGRYEVTLAARRKLELERSGQAA
jgi:hypothetical protein